MAHQILGRLQGLVNDVWAVEKPQRAAGGTAPSEAETALAMAVAIGVLQRIVHDALTPAQIEFAVKAASNFVLTPVPVDTQV